MPKVNTKQCTLRIWYDSEGAVSPASDRLVNMAIRTGLLDRPADWRAVITDGQRVNRFVVKLVLRAGSLSQRKTVIPRGVRSLANFRACCFE